MEELSTDTLVTCVFMTVFIFLLHILSHSKESDIFDHLTMFLFSKTISQQTSHIFFRSQRSSSTFKKKEEKMKPACTGIAKLKQLLCQSLKRFTNPDSRRANRISALVLLNRTECIWHMMMGLLIFQEELRTTRDCSQKWAGMWRVLDSVLGQP